MIEKIYEDIFKKVYFKTSVPEDLVLFNVKAIIKDFNSKLPNECHLPVDGSMFECIEEIATFTKLSSQAESTPVIQLSQASHNEHENRKLIGDFYKPTNDEKLCTIS